MWPYNGSSPAASVEEEDWRSMTSSETQILGSSMQQDHRPLRPDEPGCTLRYDGKPRDRHDDHYGTTGTYYVHASYIGNLEIWFGSTCYYALKEHLQVDILI